MGVVDRIVPLSLSYNVNVLLSSVPSDPLGALTASVVSPSRSSTENVSPAHPSSDVPDVVAVAFLAKSSM